LGELELSSELLPNQPRFRLRFRPSLLPLLRLLELLELLLDVDEAKELMEL